MADETATEATPTIRETTAAAPVKKKPGRPKKAPAESAKPAATPSRTERRIRCENVDAEKAAKRIERAWSKVCEREIDPVETKSFLVTSHNNTLEPLIVDNCFDEGDAKRAYFAHLNKVPREHVVRVELVE